MTTGERMSQLSENARPIAREDRTEASPGREEKRREKRTERETKRRRSDLAELAAEIRKGCSIPIFLFQLTAPLAPGRARGRHD